MKYLKLVTGSCAVCLLTFCPGCGVLPYGSIDQAQSDFAEGKYDSALGHLSKAEGYAGSRPAAAAQIGFLRGLCYDGLDQPDEARASFKSAADQYADTDCGFMAKQMLNCEPVNLGPPVEPSATRKGLDVVFDTPVRPFTYFVEAATISGDGQVMIGQQVIMPHFVFSGAPTVVNLYRWTKTGGAGRIAGFQEPNNAYTPLKLQLSTDGSVLVGNLVSTNRVTHPFRWTATDGFQDLGERPGARDTEVDCLSADGSVLAGEYIIGARTNFRAGFFRWTRRRGFENVGPIDPPPLSLGWMCGISDDGSVITATRHLRGTEGSHVYRWTESGGLQDLGTLGGRSATALCASSDGSSLVAAAEMPDKTRHIIRWTQYGVTNDLGVIDDPLASPDFASDDGSVVVGRAYLPESNLRNAVPFRWTPSSGLQYVCELGPSWAANPVGINRDGSRILLNVDYLMPYQNGGIVIPVDSMTIPIGRPATTWVFYKSFTCDFNPVSQ